LTLRKLQIENFAMGASVMNFAIDIQDFDSNKFDYDITASHIDASEIDSFVDIAANTINQRTFNYKGKALLDILIVGDIEIGIDLTATVTEEGDFTMMIQLDVGSKSIITGSFDDRQSFIEIKDGTLTINRYTDEKGGITNWNPKIRHDGTWTYKLEEAGAQALDIVTKALGLTSTASGAIDLIMGFIKPNPTIEEAFLGFTKANDNYAIDLNAANITGMSGFDNMTLNLASTKAYNVNVNNAELGQYSKVHKFIDSISADITMGTTLTVDLSLASVAGSNKYTTAGGTTYDGIRYGYLEMYTNEYYRNQYFNSIGSVA